VEELLQKIQLFDDQQAFKELYQLFFFRLYQFAYSFTRHKESAEEIVNDVFLSLWEKRKRLDGISNIRLYLYVSVKNTSLNHLRKNKMALPLSVDDLAANHLHLAADPESAMITREMSERIREAIDALPGRCRLIFKLVKEDGLSYKEASRILDISVKTVDTQLYLAMKKLSLSLLPVWTEYSAEEKRGR
jgi:RNA polymerase sigma-70 factor (ECF subfamily)